MKISYDAAKNARNIATRGLSFDRALDFDWSRSLVAEDARKDYGERRYQAMGHIDNRLYVLVFAKRDDKVHVISLRKANKREVKRYATQTKSNSN